MQEHRAHIVHLQVHLTSLADVDIIPGYTWDIQ